MLNPASRHCTAIPLPAAIGEERDLPDIISYDVDNFYQSWAKVTKLRLSTARQGDEVACSAIIQTHLNAENERIMAPHYGAGWRAEREDDPRHGQPGADSRSD